jgi:hypothetical protein
LPQKTWQMAKFIAMPIPRMKNLSRVRKVLIFGDSELLRCANDRKGWRRDNDGVSKEQ